MTIDYTNKVWSELLLYYKIHFILKCFYMNIKRRTVNTEITGMHAVKVFLLSFSPSS